MPLRQLHPDPQADVAETTANIDIIAVHGLNPKGKDISEHAWDTWRTPSGDHGHLWLRDDLRHELPESRIFLYEYNATAVYGNDQATFHDKANDLLEAIRIERSEAKCRPIIFLGHSMGGLLIKQALINAHNSKDENYQLIKTATSGLAFFATPHNGGDEKLVSLGKMAVKVAKALGFRRGDNIVKVLKSGSMFSGIMKEQFRHQTLEYDIVSFWGASDSIVPRESVRMDLPGDREKIVTLNADHSGVCKFGESLADQDNLKLVRANLKDLHYKALKKLDARNTLPDNKHLPSHYIQLARNRRFTGRIAILDDLKQRLFIRKECQKLAIFGLGGVGKTQVALQLAYWVKDNKPDYSVFWVPVLSDGSFDQAYTELARRLSVPMEKDLDLKESVQRYLSSESAGKWLLIIDNADNHELLFGSTDKPGGINEYLPHSDNGLILFTTRSIQVAISAVGNDVIDLHEMNSEEATGFLEKMLIQKKLLQNKTIIEELFEELTYLPLAITQAVAYLNRNQTTIEKYLTLLRGTEQNMVSVMSREFHDNTRYPVSQNAVATTWLVSFDEIRKSDNAAAELLSFISCIEPKAIPQSLLPNRWSDEEMENAIGTLLGYAFLVRQEEEDMFDMHRLVHVALRIHQTNSVMVETIQHLKTIFPSDRQENRELWRRYLPHALRVLERSSECQIDERYELFYSVGRCLHEDRRFTEAVKAFEEIYTWRREHAYQDTNKQLGLESWLADAYSRTGRIKEAIKIYEYIAVIRRRELPDDDNRRLESEHDLATAYLDNGQIKEATDILEQIVAIEGKTLAEDDYNRLASEHGLAKAYLIEGRIKEAIKISEHVVAFRKQILREEDNSRLSSEHNLASAYLDDGQIKEAVGIIERVVAIRRRVLTEEDYNRLASEHLLARAYLEDGRIKEAIKIFEYVGAIRKQTLREEDGDRLTSEYNLASAYLYDGRVKEATEMFERVVAIRRRVLPEEDGGRLASEHSLAAAYLKANKVREAIALLEHIVAADAKILAEDDPERVLTQELLTKAYSMI